MTDETKPNAQPVAAKRRWFRFSLRSLLVLVVVLAVPLGWIAKERRQSIHEHEIAETLRTQGFEVEFGGSFDSWELLFDEKPQGWWRDTSRQLLGERVIWLNLLDCDYSDVSRLGELSTLELLCLTRTQVCDITPLAKVTNLRYLEMVGTPVNDIRPLAGLKNLKMLQLQSTRVSDLTPLANLTQLSELDLSNTQVSDVSPLVKLTGLKTLKLYNTNVNDENVRVLRQALPNCNISHKAIDSP